MEVKLAYDLPSPNLLLTQKVQHKEYQEGIEVGELETLLDVPLSCGRLSQFCDIACNDLVVPGLIEARAPKTLETHIAHPINSIEHPGFEHAKGQGAIDNNVPQQVLRCASKHNRFEQQIPINIVDIEISIMFFFNLFINPVDLA